MLFFKPLITAGRINFVLKDHKGRTDFNAHFLKKIIHSTDIIVRENTPREHLQNIYTRLGCSVFCRLILMGEIPIKWGIPLLK